MTIGAPNTILKCKLPYSFNELLTEINVSQLYYLEINEQRQAKTNNDNNKNIRMVIIIIIITETNIIIVNRPRVKLIIIIQIRFLTKLKDTTKYGFYYDDVIRGYIGRVEIKSGKRKFRFIFVVREGIGQ